MTAAKAIIIIVLVSIPDAASASSVFSSVCTASSAAIFLQLMSL